MATGQETAKGYPPGRPAGASQSDESYYPIVRRISPWAVLAGAVVGLVVLFLLSLFGLGIGFATVDPAPGGSGTPSARTFSIGSAVWGIVTFLLALFAGGWIAGRLAGNTSKLDGLLHGVVAWALATLAVMWLTATAVSGIIGGAFSIAGNVASATVAGAQATAEGGSGAAIAEAVQQVVPWDRVEQRLERALPGDVELDRETMMNALRRFLVEGGDRQAVIDVLVNEGGMAPEEAESTVQNMENEYREAVQQVERQAAQAAEATADAVSSAALWSFLALLLAGAAAAAGGWLGAPRDELVAGRALR